MGFTLTKKDIDDVVNCVPDTVERVLKLAQYYVFPLLLIAFLLDRNL